MTTQHIVLCTTVLLYITSVATADITQYSDRDAWFNDVGGAANVTTLGFTEFPIDTIISDQYAHLGITFSGFNQAVGPAPGYSDGWTLKIYNGNYVDFEEPINWISFDIRGAIEIELFLGDEKLATTDFQFDPFFGIYSDEPFDRVHVYNPFAWILDADNLHFGPPIPAPGVLAPMAMLLCSRSRRSRRH